MTRLLVTAVGGDLGQALVKAARLAEPRWACVGADLDPEAPGAAFTDGFAVLPPASAGADYLAALDRACRAHRIDALVPASEPELRALAAHPVLPCGTKVVAQPADWAATFGDKLACMRALRGKVPLAPFADGADPDEVKALVGEAGFPLVVKPRRGSGSRALRIARDARELHAALEAVPDALVQQHLSGDGGEFSIGAWAGEAGSVLIAFRRELGPGGASWSAETVDDPDVLAYAAAIVRASGARGSVNIQVRRSAGQVRLLEVNARFSSLVAARALCGFRDLEWSVAEALGRPVALPRGPFRPLRFRRFLHEVVDLGQGWGAVPAWAPRPAGAAPPAPPQV